MTKGIFVFFGTVFSLTVVIAQPFPASIAKWTEQDKQQQRKAGSQMLNKLYGAIKSGKKSFSIPKGITALKRQ